MYIYIYVCVCVWHDKCLLNSIVQICLMILVCFLKRAFFRTKDDVDIHLRPLGLQVCACVSYVYTTGRDSEIGRQADSARPEYIVLNQFYTTIL